MSTDAVDPSPTRLPARAADVAPFRLGEWTVEPALNRVGDGRRTETIEPRMMHVLVCLVAVPGRVVTRRELLDVVWRDVIVGEEALTRSVSRLRRVLGDDPQEPRYFETIRGGGYRVLQEPRFEADRPAPRPRRTRRWWAIVPVLVAAGALFAVLQRPPRQPPVAVPLVVPVTTLPGNEAFPAFAPDGRTVVFTWTGNEGEAPGLFIKQLGVEEPRRLTRPDGVDSRAVFSPDGATVAFVRQTRDGFSLRTVPAVGGATRLLAETSAVFGLTWNPSGTDVVFAAENPASGVSCLQRLDLQTLQVAELSKVDPATHTGDSWPVFSPDGNAIAFVRCDHAGLQDLWLLPAAGGAGRPITQGLGQCNGLTWLPGSREVIVSAAPRGRLDLCRVRLADGAVSRLPVISPGHNTQPAAAPDGSALVFRCLIYDYDLQRLDLGSGADAVEPQAFAPATRNEVVPAWSPDGSRVAFVSDRSGSSAIWLARGDGSRPRLVAARPDADIAALFWAPDNRRVAANLRAGLQAWVEIVDTETGLADTLGVDAGYEQACGWSAESDRISLLRDEGAAWKLYRMRDDGSEAVPLDLGLTGHPRVRESGEGHLYENPEDGGLYRLAPDGTRRRLLSAADMAHVRQWSATAAGLHVLRLAAPGRVVIEIIDPEDGPGRTLAEVPEQTLDFAVSPDGRQVLLTTLSRVESDLMMIAGPLASLR